MKLIASFSLADTKDRNEAFGSSLLLSNSPMSPKVVNGSFAAIFDADEFLAKTYAGIRIAVSLQFYYYICENFSALRKYLNFLVKVLLIKEVTICV